MDNQSPDIYICIYQYTECLLKRGLASVEFTNIE